MEIFGQALNMPSLMLRSLYMTNELLRWFEYTKIYHFNTLSCIKSTKLWLANWKTQ